MTPNNALVRHSKDPFLPWHDSTELFRRCEDIVLSLTPRTLVIGTSHFMAASKHGDYFGGII